MPFNLAYQLVICKAFYGRCTLMPFRSTFIDSAKQNQLRSRTVIQHIFLHIFTKLRFECHAVIVDWGLGRKGRKWPVWNIDSILTKRHDFWSNEWDPLWNVCIFAVWYCVTMFLLVFFRGVTEEGRCTQDGHHSGVLRGKKCSHHRGHRLYGESTSGEAATLLFRCQSCLCACPAQSRTGAWCPYCWHDQLQGEQVQVWRIAGEHHGFFSQFWIIILNYQAGWVIFLMA